MARKKANYPLIESLEIVSVAAEGKALGRYNDVVVFVPMAVPGDVVDVQVRSKRRRFMEGYIVRFVKKSPMRVDPVCEHYGVCGGCKWQHLPYEEQLRFKQEQVTDQLTRIGKVDLPAVSPIIGSEKTFFYRNKLEFTFSSKRWLTDEEVASGTEFADNEALGFHIPNMFDKVLDIRKCWLQADPSNPIRMAVREFCIAGGYSFYNPREHAGLMRNLIVRVNETSGITVVVSSHVLDQLDRMATRYGVIADGRMVREMTAEEVAAECRSSLRVRTENPARALALLEEAYPALAFKAEPDGAIVITGDYDDGAISRLLAGAGEVVRELSQDHRDLEEYFVELMEGGAQYV